jgi:pilus assembly protein Flp/PilA
VFLYRLSHWIGSLFRDNNGQDMVEYALFAGFIAVAAGAVLPPIADTLSQIFSKMASVTSAAAAQ